MAKRKTAKKRGKATRVTTMNVSMPEVLKDFVEDRVESAGFGTVSEYVRHLIFQDQDRADRAQRRMRQLIQEGERSGPPIVADEKFWAERRAALEKALERNRRKAG